LDKIFRKRNARLLCRYRLTKAVSRELWKVRLGILSMQGGRWNNYDAEGTVDLIFFGKTI